MPFLRASFCLLFLVGCAGCSLMPHGVATMTEIPMGRPEASSSAAEQDCATPTRR